MANLKKQKSSNKNKKELTYKHCLYVIPSISRVPGLEQLLLKKYTYETKEENSSTDTQESDIGIFWSQATTEEKNAYIVLLDNMAIRLADMSLIHIDLIEAVLLAEKSDKSGLASLIESHIKSISSQELLSSIQSKKKAQDVAFAVAVIDDYIDYLESDRVWKNLAIARYEDISSFRRRYNISLEMLYRTYRKLTILDDIEKKELEKINGISPILMRNELKILYSLAKQA